MAQALGSALSADGSGFGDAVERVVVDRGELTFHVRREHLLAVADKLLHDPALRFEIFSGVSGVHYPAEAGPGAERGLPPGVDHAQPAGPARGGARPTPTRTSRR